MKIGDEVCYSQEFLHNICGFDAEVANRTGQIVEFKYGGKFASIEWDDGATNTVKLSNLCKTKSNVPSTGNKYHEQLLEQRAGIYLQLGAEFYGEKLLANKPADAIDTPASSVS